MHSGGAQVSQVLRNMRPTPQAESQWGVKQAGKMNVCCRKTNRAAPLSRSPKGNPVTFCKGEPEVDMFRCVNDNTLTGGV